MHRYSVSNRIAVACLLTLLCACNVGDQQRRQSAAPSKEQQAISTQSAIPHRVYVTNERSGDLSIIDGATHEVLHTVALGKRPRGIQVSPDRRQLFIALSGSPIAGPGVDESALPPSDPSADGIGVFDISTLTLSRIIRGVSDPEQMVVSKDGERLYIASEDTGTAVVVDVATGKNLATLPVGGEPEGVGISPDGRFVYMTSEEHHQVSVIDTAENRIIAQFKVGQRPRQAAFSPDGSRAYVTGEMDATVSVVDANTHRVLHTVQLTGELVRPMEVDVSLDGKLAYVTTGRGRTLVALDTTTYEPVKSVIVGTRPWGLAMSPDGKSLYTANGPSNDVTIVDAETFAVTATVSVGTGPWGVVAVQSR